MESALPDPSDPDFVSEYPGEHMELEDADLSHFWIDKRRFDVEIEEAANGVWHATTETHRSGNGRLYHPAYAPYDVPMDEIDPISVTEATPAEAYDALKSEVENEDKSS